MERVYKGSEKVCAVAPMGAWGAWVMLDGVRYGINDYVHIAWEDDAGRLVSPRWCMVHERKDGSTYINIARRRYNLDDFMRV